ncbi:MAG: roadblock/LC7 domain-containing protein [Verrucomicrobiota bacterium]
MSLFGSKKPGLPNIPKAPAGVSVPPTPPTKDKSGGPGGRKRITQRLVLGGKGVETGEINVNSGLKIPGAPDPVVSQMAPVASIQGEVGVPLANILGFIPAEFLYSDHESLYQDPISQQPVNFPLSLILPMLPSGKVEMLAQDLYNYIPQGVMKSGDELGDYAHSPVALPLEEIISRIPQDAFMLRADQKPIDNNIVSMDEPFSAEMLAAAAEEAQQKAAAAEQAAEPVPEPVSEPAVPEMPPATTSPPVDPPAAESEFDPAPMEPIAPEPLATEEQGTELVPHAEDPQGDDFSFAQSDAFKSFVENMEGDEQSAPVAEAPTAPVEEVPQMPEVPELPEEPPVAELPEEPPVQEDPVPPPTIQPPALERGLPDDYSDTDVTQVIPKETQEAYDQMAEASDSQSPAFGTPPPADPEKQGDHPLYAPTRVVGKQAVKEAAKPLAVEPPKPKAKPAFSLTPPKPAPKAKPAAPPKPPIKPVAKPAFAFKAEPAAEEVSVPQLPSKSAKPKSAPVFSFKSPKKAASAVKPEAKTESKPQSPDVSPQESAPLAQAPTTSSSPSQDIIISQELCDLLGLKGMAEPTLKDIVHQVNSWPGMKGCIVGGQDGLRISSDVEDDTFANSISAFAPKLISKISELFNDLGFDDVQELHTPIKDASVYIFRKDSLYLIVLFDDTSLPDSYRALLKQVLGELNLVK